MLSLGDLNEPPAPLDPMPLLTNVNTVYAAKKAATSGNNYLNSSSIEADEPTRFTILGDSSCAGYECWVNGADGKRKCLRFASEPTRQDLQDRAVEEDITLIGDEKAKPFYAFFIWSYNEECVQVFQFSQQSIIDPIIQNLSDEEISQEPWAYDFKATTNGLSGLDKRYSITCVPGKRRTEKVNKQIEALWSEVVNQGANLSNLLVGADPFKQSDVF